jgi:hypothetical protein
MVTTGNFGTLRRQNFGMRALRDTPTVDALAREIARYDAGDAAAVSQQVRDLAGHEAQIDQLLATYADVLAEPRPEADGDAEQRAAAAYLRLLSPKLHERDLLRNAVARLLQLPVAGTWVRWRARREPAGHWLQELLRSMDSD